VKLGQLRSFASARALYSLRAHATSASQGRSGVDSILDQAQTSLSVSN
jgi:hypothetical protein